MFYRDEKLALFIDGINLYATSRALGFDIDYKKLRAEFARRGKLVRAAYYTAVVESEGNEHSPIRPLVDWLNYNGFTTVTRTSKEYHDSNGNRRAKASMAVDLTVDVLEIAPHVDHIVLVSGDGYFCPLVAAVQRKGTRVSIISSVRTSPPMVADELRRQVENFIELADLKEIVGRPPREVPRTPAPEPASAPEIDDSE